MATESATPSASPFGRVTAFARSSAAAPVALAVMMLVSVLARVWLARAVKTPWILIDEFLYSEQAKSFAANGNYWIRGAPSSIVSYLYPALISPAWWADSMRTTYGLAKTINFGPDDARRDSRVPLGDPHRTAPFRLRGSGPDLAPALVLLHRRADDGERVLPGVRHERLRHRASARAADAGSPGD